MTTPQSSTAVDRARWIADAERVLESGGVLTWTRWEVTDSEGISRSMRGGHGQPLWYPPLDGAQHASLHLRAGEPSTVSNATVGLSFSGALCSLTIEAEDDEITSLITAITRAVESQVDASLLPAPPTFKVFIGHGGDPQWKYLQRALNDTHGMVAEAFESAERAGYHTLVVVDQMVRSSTVAVVVMTGEDQDSDGNLRARENVVHEVGFCQGALGIENTIVMLEDGISEPSNIAGLTQVRFSRGRLIDVEERIVAVLEQRRQLFAYRAS